MVCVEQSFALGSSALQAYKETGNQDLGNHNSSRAYSFSESGCAQLELNKFVHTRVPISTGDQEQSKEYVILRKSFRGSEEGFVVKKDMGCVQLL